MGETTDSLPAIFFVADACLVLRRMVGDLILGVSKHAIFTACTATLLGEMLARCVPIPNPAIRIDGQSSSLTLKVEIETPHRLVISTESGREV
jgi:hypothetical protein